MRHDIENAGTMSEAYPHLIFNNFTSKLGKRCVDILKYLFPVPKDESKRVITFSNTEDFISFRYRSFTFIGLSQEETLSNQVFVSRHHTFKKSETNRNEIDLNEVGPRFELKRKQISMDL